MPDATLNQLDNFPRYSSRMERSLTGMDERSAGLLIRVGIHPKLNRLPRGATKETRQADKARMNSGTADGWQCRESTLDELAAYLSTGASIAAVFADGHRHTESAQAQFIAVDFDKDDPDRAAIEADARALGCAAIIGETATTGHYRVVIPLSESVNNAEQFRGMVARVSLRFHGATDPAGGVIAQPWYGFRPDLITVISGELLAVAAIMEMPAAPEPVRAWRREPAPLVEGAAQDRRAEFISSAVMPAIDRAVTHGRGKHFQCINPDHDDHNPSARIGPSNDGGLMYFCTCGHHSLTTVSGWLGLSYSQWLRETHPIEAKARKAKRPAQQLRTCFISRMPSPESESVEFVSDSLPPSAITAIKTLLISAPTGGGKTTAIARYVDTLPPDAKKTGIAQFRLLTRTLAQVLDFPHYEDADGAHQAALGQLSELVSSVQSIAKFNRHGGTVVIDELEGVLHFLSDSSTFKNSEAVAALRSLKTLVQSADQLIGMDANLSEIAIRWIEGLRGPATVKHFTPSKQRGSVILLKDETAGLYQIGKLLKHRRGPVYVACSSENMASQVAELYADYRVLKVTRDTSNTATVKAASTDAGARSAYDLIVYDSSWGAGVDIAEPVYAQVCLFDRMPLAPEDALQLWGRVRTAKRRYAAVPSDSEGYPTASADELLADKLKRERWTAQRLGRTPQDAGDMLELAQVWAQFEARRQREIAQWRRSFIRRLQANGFTVAANNAPAPEVFAATWKQWRKDRKDQHWGVVLASVGAALPDNDLDLLRMKGEEITVALKLRNTRFKIERALAVETVSERDRDLMNGQHRQRLFRLADLLTEEYHSLDADRAQADEGKPIHKRRYATLDRRTISRLFELAGHTGTPEQQLLAFVEYFRIERSAAEVEARYEALTSDRAARLVEALGHRGNNSRTVTGLCRWMLDQFGLKLISRQRRAEGARCMFYEMDADVLAYRLARARRAVRERMLSKNVILTEGFTFLDTPEAAATEPSATGWAAAPEQFNRQFGALIEPMGMGY